MFQNNQNVIRLPLGASLGTYMGEIIPMRYDEAYYDPLTGSYRTRSQDYQITKLQQELVVKKKEEREKVRSIIGYFYKRR